jgi:DNA-binding GntR family transcriptional regulator
MASVRSVAPKLLSRRSLVDGVRESLIDAILTGRLAPGDRVIEANVARDLGVSRGPVREAFRQLAEQGLLVLVPHRGAAVATLTERDAYEIYSLLVFTERLALRFIKRRLSDAPRDGLRRALDAMQEAAARGDASAVARADLAFNDALYECAGHRRLQQLWTGLKYQSFLLVWSYASRAYPSLTAIVEHHARIVNLLEHARWDELLGYLEANADRVELQLLDFSTIATTPT